MNNSESSQTMCIVVMMVRRQWGWCGWSAVLHRGCFIKLVSGINEPQQKPPWHDIHDTHWEQYQHARCISVGVLIVSNSEMSGFYFVMRNVKSQWTYRLSDADRALWAKKKPMMKGRFQQDWGWKLPWVYADDVQLWTDALFCSEYLQPGYLKAADFCWNWGRADISLQLNPLIRFFDMLGSILDFCSTLLRKCMSSFTTICQSKPLQEIVPLKSEKTWLPYCTARSYRDSLMWDCGSTEQH